MTTEHTPSVVQDWEMREKALVLVDHSYVPRVLFSPNRYIAHNGNMTEFYVSQFYKQYVLFQRLLFPGTPEKDVRITLK